jgi:hypothetical protein
MLYWPRRRVCTNAWPMDIVRSERDEHDIKKAERHAERAEQDAADAHTIMPLSELGSDHAADVAR